MAQVLYMEVEGIQRFVFASSKLKIIRGGSALVDLFNRIEMPREACAKGGHVVFAGGGHCLVRGLSPEAAHDVAQNLRRQLRRMTDGQVDLSFGVAPADGAWKTVWARLRADLEERALDPPRASPPLPPFVAQCASCGLSPARELCDTQDRDLTPLCAACVRRANETTKIYNLHRETIWDRIRRHLVGQQVPGDDASFRRLLPEREFSELAEQGSGKKYLAYLYCDGNGMGRHLSEVSSDEEYREISRLVDGALHAAVASAIQKLCLPERSGGTFGAEVLLLGGDDLIVALPADRGAEFTREVLEVFHRRTNGRLRLSAGLVFAPRKTPIAVLQHVADSLLRSAKRYAYLDEARQRLGRRTLSEANDTAAQRRPLADGYVDFQELTSAQADIERHHAITCKPYRLDDFTTLVKRTRAAWIVPKSRLHALAEAVRGSEREARTVADLIAGRARSERNHDERAAVLDLLRPLYDPAKRGRAQPYTTYPAGGLDLPFDLYWGIDPAAHRWSQVLDAIELIEHIDPTGRIA